MSTRYHETTTNYSGRTVDMLLLQFIATPGPETTVLPDVSRAPRIVTGIEKLVQRYALLFLTQAGTIRNRETEGSDFMGQLGSGRIYDENTLRTAAASANKTVYSQLRAEDRSMETADDEAIASSVVTETRIDRRHASAYVTVKITSVAGDSYTYTMPLKTGV